MKQAMPVGLIERDQLRGKIQTAIAEKQAKEAQKKAEHRANDEQRLRRLIRAVLGVEYTEPFDATDNDPVAHIDGFRFTYGGVDTYSYKDSLAWLRTCELCGKEDKTTVYDYASLDESRPISYPHGEGNCVPKDGAQQPETTETLLLQRLREFIYENTFQG